MDLERMRCFRAEQNINFTVFCGVPCRVRYLESIPLPNEYINDEAGEAVGIAVNETRDVRIMQNAPYAPNTHWRGLQAPTDAAVNSKDFIVYVCGTSRSVGLIVSDTQGGGCFEVGS